MNAYNIVTASRSKDKPTSITYIRHLFTGFTELHGDRRQGDDSAVITGIASLGGVPVTVIATEKGRNLKERTKLNFGSAHPEGYRKALRQMKQAEKFCRPVICFVDTAGAFCGIDAETRGQGQAIAENLYEMMTLKTPIISVFIGEGGSGGALALAVADRVWITEKAYYSVISPEGCASIMWKDAKKAPEAAESLKLTPADLLRLGVVDRVLEEREFSNVFFASLGEQLLNTIAQLKASGVDIMLEERYKRFRGMGIYDEHPERKERT